MPDFFATGQHRIAYRSNQFAKGVSVNLDVYGPDDAWDTGNSLTEIASGLYYIDYTFPTTGAYIANFYEGNTQTAAQTYRVQTVTAVGGSGASAQQVWEYGTRTLTDGASSAVTDYISSQVTWISGQLEEYSAGGGGGTKYVVAGGKKSPWTYRQKEFVIETIEKINDSLDSLDRKIDNNNEDTINKSNELKGMSSKNLEEIENTRDQLQSMISDKKVQDKSINNINNELLNLNKQIEYVKEDVNNKEDLENLSDQIDNLCNLLAKSLSDSELEELLEKYSE